MDKRVYFPGCDTQGNPLVRALIFGPRSMEKTASVGHDLLHPALQSYIKAIKPDPEHMYVLVNAMGAWEYYGQNINGDAFREEVLSNDDPTNGYKTFYKARVYRHHCFPAGSEVVTLDNRRTPIEDIQSGGYVLNRQNRTSQVLSVIPSAYKGPGISLSLKGKLEDLVGTADHPVLVYKREQIHCRHNYCRLTDSSHSERCKSFREPVGDPEWIPLREVQPGDYLTSPKMKLGAQTPAPEFARLVGWVASEGYLGKDGYTIQFSFGENNEADLYSVTKCLEENGCHVTTTPRPQQGTVMLTTSNKGLHANLSEYIEGVKSEKRLTQRVFFWDEESVLQLLGAYVDGDGHIYKTGKNKGQLRIRSASKQMLYILGDLVGALGVPTAINWDGKPKSFSIIEGYGPYHTEGSGCVSVSAHYSPLVGKYSRKKVVRNGRRPTNLLKGNTFLVRVLDAEVTELDETVYNLEVDGDHTYIVNEAVVHNCNKQPEKGFGDVVVSIYNPRMHRIELLLKINRKKAKAEGHSDLVDALDRGENPAVSMGMRTPYDVCLVCANRSRTRADYCPCMRTPGKIMPDGKQVGVDNPIFKAFDISFVLIGADRISFAIEKVASVDQLLYLQELAKKDLQKVSSRKKLAAKKVADIIKRIPAMTLDQTEKSLPKKTLNSLAKLPTKQALASPTAAGIVLKPREFQRIILIRMGMPGMADKMDAQRRVFAPCSCAPDRSFSFSESDASRPAIRLVLPHVQDRSIFGPSIYKRLSLQKVAASGAYIETRDPVLDRISAAYDGYRLDLLDKIANVSKNVTLQLPEVLDRIYPDELEEILSGVRRTKTAAAKDVALLVGALPWVYLLSRAMSKEDKKSDGAIESFVKRHPAIAASIAVGLARSA